MTALTETARRIFEQALADCSVEQATARHLTANDNFLFLDGEPLPLDGVRCVQIIAAGKAAAAMLRSVLQILPTSSEREITGLLIAPEPPLSLPGGFQFFPGGHPSPNQASFSAAQAALHLSRKAADDPDRTLCLFLLSGGASAMMELPLDPAITLADTAEFHRVLVASGASITEINCVRKHFSAVKGGRLAKTAGNARCHSLLISDVAPGSADALGSGPTLPDPTTVADCRQILAFHHLNGQFPDAVRRFFDARALPETPKPAELTARFSVLLDSGDLARAAADHAQALGWSTILDTRCDDWDYRDAAAYLLDRLRALHREHPRLCLISAGEVTVNLRSGPIGIGGRNQQFALYAATLLAPADGAAVILSAGTDGMDGNSPAAGAAIDRDLVADPNSRAAALLALESFNAHPFLAARNATITTGTTGNNLRDLRLLLQEYPSALNDGAPCSAIP